MALCVTCVFAVTLAVFPVIMVRVQTVYKDDATWGETPGVKGQTVFPVTKRVTFSVSLLGSDKVFTCVSFIIFNVMDLAGRSTPALVQWVSPPPFSITFLVRCELLKDCLVSVQPPRGSLLFPAAVTSRLIFIPLIMLCNVENSRLTVIFRHDSAFIVLMVLFSFSNGYLATLCMAYAPQ